MIKPGTRSAIVLAAFCASTSAAFAQVNADRVPRFVQGSPIEELAAQFRAGRAPAPRMLVGAWEARQHVITETFITGRAGPDRVYHDSATLAFRLENGGVQVLYSGMRRWTSPRFNAAGDVVFEADDAGDVAVFYSCRLSQATRLICFDLDHLGVREGDAIEFVKKQPS
jgi:hypothetical protein